MTEERDRRHLQVVPPRESFDSTSQLALFASPNPRLIVFAPMTSIPGQVFLRALERLQPRLLFDLRVLPRFDFPGLSRAIAFFEFEQRGLVYRDIPGLLKVESRRDVRLNPALLAAELVRFLPNPCDGPVFFLTETTESAGTYSRALPALLDERFTHWDVKVGWGELQVV
jgi:hypothetical protein